MTLARLAVDQLIALVVVSVPLEVHPPASLAIIVAASFAIPCVPVERRTTPIIALGCTWFCGSGGAVEQWHFRKFCGFCLSPQEPVIAPGKFSHESGI